MDKRDPSTAVANSSDSGSSVTNPEGKRGGRKHKKRHRERRSHGEGHERSRKKRKKHKKHKLAHARKTEKQSLIECNHEEGNVVDLELEELERKKRELLRSLEIIRDDDATDHENFAASTGNRRIVVEESGTIAMITVTNGGSENMSVSGSNFIKEHEGFSCENDQEPAKNDSKAVDRSVKHDDYKKETQSNVVKRKVPELPNKSRDRNYFNKD